VNPYKPIPAKIKDIIEETPTIKTFVLDMQEPIPFLAGQFMEVTYPGVGEAPFTPSSSPANADVLEFTIMRVGLVTERLHNAKVGELVGVRGPYGKPYPLEEYYGKDVYIVGGGVGLAPLRALLYALLMDPSKYNKIVLRYGARTPADLVYKRQLLEEWSKMDVLDVKITVDRADENWDGHVGVVTTILSPDDVDIPNSAAVVCGPPIMMKFATLKLLEMGFKPEQIYLSMERKMSCGIGKCGKCRIGMYYTCKDGPVFRYDKVMDVPDVWV